MCHNLSAPAITSDKIKLAKEELARDLSTSITRMIHMTEYNRQGANTLSTF